MAENCVSTITSVRHFSQQVLWSLRITNSIIGLLNIVGNSLLIYALKKTGQTTTISLQLIVLMSISDVVNGTFALSLTNILLWKKFDSICCLKLITQFLHRIFVGLSFGIVIAIALDRFLHIKYLQRYSIIVRRRRMWCLVFILLLYNLLVGSLSSMPFLNNYIKVVNIINAFLIAGGMITVFVLYYKTTRAINLRVSSMDNIHMQRTVHHIKTIVNVALSISACTLLTLAPFIIVNIILEVSNSYRAENTTELAIFKWVTYLGTLGNGVCSCVIFVLYNRPVKRFIVRKIMHNQ